MKQQLLTRRLVMGVTGAAMLAASGMVWAESPWRHAGAIGMRHFVVVETARSGDAEMFRQAAGEVCADGQACVVVFLPDGSSVPEKMPMTRAQQRAVVAQYFRNPATGSEELLLKCRADEANGHKCLR